MDRDLTVGFGMPTIGLDKLSLCINADTLSECRSVKIVCNGVEHTYDPAKLKDALIWILAPYEIHENPSYECMRVAREESRAELLEMRRWDVSQRLKEIEFGLGNHENLLAVASVIYEPKYGWTLGACNYLRDQLVELIGGERASDAQRGCVGGAGGCDCRHESEEVGDGISGGDCGVREVRHNRDLRDMGDCHFPKEALMTYDVLNNERHKAVCELRKLRDDIDNLGSYYDFTLKLFKVFRISDCFWDEGLKSLCDYLIHLLGGDEVVRNAENYNLGDEPDVKNDENGVFCEYCHTTITSELREWASTEVPYKHGHQLHAIADRIDEQFARICEQQEKVLQDTKIVMQDEIERTKIMMQNEVDRQKGLRDENAQVAEAAIYNSCMYLNLLRDAARDYKRLHDDYVELSHDHRELYDFAKVIEQAVKDDNEITLFGVDYTPCDHVEDVDEDVRLINLYHKKFRQLMGEAKNLRDTFATRVEGRDHVRQELEEYRKALNETAGKLVKADAECRMYREMLNNAAKEYKALQDSLGLVFGLWWMSATGGFK